MLVISGQDTGSGMVGQLRQLLADGGCFLSVNPGCQDDRRHPEHGGKDISELTNTLVGTEHRLRQSCTNGPMMVDPGGLQHFDRPMTKTVKRLVDSKGTVLDLLQQGF